MLKVQYTDEGYSRTSLLCYKVYKYICVTGNIKSYKGGDVQIHSAPVLIRHEAGTLSRPLPDHSIGLAHSDEIYRQEEARIHPHAARCKSDARQRRLARPPTPIGDVLC